MNAKTLKANAPIPAGLPKSLRPWSQLFQEMPEAHLRLIGGLMGQLNPLLEESFDIEGQSYGEFNGYDGIEMRGEIERLMPSEWLWKDLIPEEFLRRFAEQELFYHKPSFESPTDERTHLVAIDCGPGMLGRPRLIALAALLCLGAIARRQGAKLLWAAPQADVAEWQMLGIRKNLQAFLLATNPLSLSGSQLDALLQHLPGRLHKADLVLWTISSKELIPVDDTVRSNQLVVSETMAIDTDGRPFPEASIRLRCYFERTKETTLTYPPEEDCVSLLREPFRLRRTKAASKPVAKGEANPSWAPQGILMLAEMNKMIVRVREGLLFLSLGPYDGGFHDPRLIPIEGFDNILGLRLANNRVTLALTRKYNGFSQLVLKRFPVHFGRGDTHQEISKIKLDQNDPLAVNKHPKSALPPLIKPGRKFRLLALTSKGEQYVIHKNKAEPHAQLPHLPVIGARDNWAFALAGSETEKLLLARNLATSQCISFALPENAAVTGLNDIIYWPDELSADSSFLLGRCDDGYWRGQCGKPGIVPYNQFPQTPIEVDLSEFKDAVPLGHYKKQRGKPPYPAYRMCLLNPVDGSKFYCGFTLAGRVDMELLDIDPASCDRGAMPNIVRYKSWPLSWVTDDQGFAKRIDKHKPFEETTFGKEPESHSIAGIIEKAKCLSE